MLTNIGSRGSTQGPSSLQFLQGLLLDHLLIDHQMGWRLVLGVRFICLLHRHIFSEYYLRCISALPMDLRRHLFLENLWLSLKLPRRLPLKPVLHRQNRTVRVLLNTAIDILGRQRVSLVLWNVFLAHVHNIRHPLPLAARLLLSRRLHINRINNLCAGPSQPLRIPEHVGLAGFGLGAVDVLSRQTITWFILGIPEAGLVDEVATSKHNLNI